MVNLQDTLMMLISNLMLLEELMMRFKEEPSPETFAAIERQLMELEEIMELRGPAFEGEELESLASKVDSVKKIVASFGPK